MQWIPIQMGRYVLSNLFVWMGRVALTIVSLFIAIRSMNMFEHITDINIAIAVCAVAMLAWVSITRYTAYVAHIKKNANADEAKKAQCKEFAWVPYFVIPILFGAVAVIGGLKVADFAAMKGYIALPEDIVIVAAIATVIIDAVFDWAFVDHIGDTVYFQTIESKVADAAKSLTDGVSEEDLKLLAVLKQLKN